jgi:hypothetical protein
MDDASSFEWRKPRNLERYIPGKCIVVDAGTSARMRGAVAGTQGLGINTRGVLIGIARGRLCSSTGLSFAIA